MSETISKDDTENEKKIAQEWFRELRDQFCNKFEEIDGGKFTRKTWKHSGEGGGEMSTLKGARVRRLDELLKTDIWYRRSTKLLGEWYKCGCTYAISLCAGFSF